MALIRSTITSIFLFLALASGNQVKRAKSSVTLSLKQRTRQSAQAGRATAFFGEVWLGSPAQVFSVAFDTGSGNLLVPGAECTSEVCQKHKRFRPDASSTSRPVNCDGSDVSPGMWPDELTISFGTGHITGDCFQDVVCLGKACTKGMFLAAREESSNPFDTFGFDGVLGMSLPRMSQSPDFSMVNHMLQQEGLLDPKFSLFLSRSEAEPSEVTFGDVDEERMAEELFWAPVAGDNGYWQVGIDGITLKGEEQPLCEHCQVVVDSGTSSLAGPTWVVDELTRRLHIADDCSNYDQLPELGFVIGGHTLTLAPEDYVRHDDPNSCSVNLMTLDVPPPKGPLFVLGIPFLQRYYSVYDPVQRRIGFALAKQKGGPSVLQAWGERPKRLRARGRVVSLPLDADQAQ